MDCIDDYAACKETYATFQIYPGNKDPNEITNYLGIKPGKIVLAGMAGEDRRTINGWFVSTKHKVYSKDLRRHIDWLLDKIQPVAKQIGGCKKAMGQELIFAVFGFLQQETAALYFKQCQKQCPAQKGK